jgi:hypothetical protein
MRITSFIILVASLFGAASRAATPEVLFAKGSWAALGYGKACEAAAAAAPPASNRQPAARAGFRVAGAGVANFYARLSRTARPGSSVMLTIGDRPFLLTGRGDWAWSTGPAQEAAIVAAIRAATSMRVEARDSGGRRFSDRYLLDGAPTAIDAAAAACAGKI